jgi:hypothetical protein
MRRALIAIALAACASQAFPPGGPEDPDPPSLIGVVPDSGAVNVATDREVVFRFDEVVNERPSGVANLRDLVLISPRQGEPRVDWSRSSIGVRARGDWRESTVYTVTLLPGLQDLRSNVRRQPSTVVFSTGPTLPDTRLTGAVFDWVAGRPAAGAIVEAITPDSVVYVGAADSVGRFTLAHLPAGTYRVRGFADPNRNRELDPREPFDTAMVRLTDTASLDLYAFVHDSAGPRIESVAVRDSLTVRATFDKALAPGQSLDTSQVRLVRADSTPVRVMSASLTRPEVVQPPDTARRAGAVPLPRPAADTTDTTGVRAPPRPRRVPPPSQITLQVFPPLEPATTYVLTIRDVQNLLGIPATTRRTFTSARRVAPPAAGDTTPPPAAPPARE